MRVHVSAFCIYYQYYLLTKKYWKKIQKPKWFYNSLQYL